MISLVNAQCIEPENRMEIKEDILFCSGTYFLPDGVEIASNNVVLDCSNSILRGSFAERGLTINKKSSITIKNCVIEDYEEGIYLENSTKVIISNNVLSNNEIGIKLINSFENRIANNKDNSTIAPLEVINSKFNIFSFSDKELSDNDYCGDNVCDSLDNINPCEDDDGYCSPSCNPKSDNDCKTVESIIPAEEQIIEEKTEKETPLEEETKPSNKEILLQAFKLKKQLDEEEAEKEVDNILNKYAPITNENLVIKRNFEYNPEDGTTTVTLSITPKKKVHNVSLYEHIPKCFSTYLSDIVFLDENFEIIKEDPLIMWHFQVFSEEKSFSYKINKKISEKCKELFVMVGIATDFEKKTSKSKLIFPLIVTLFIIIIIVYFGRFKK